MESRVHTHKSKINLKIQKCSKIFFETVVRNLINIFNKLKLYIHFDYYVRSELPQSLNPNFDLCKIVVSNKIKDNNDDKRLSNKYFQG